MLGRVAWARVVESAAVSVAVQEMSCGEVALEDLVVGAARGGC